MNSIKSINELSSRGFCVEAGIDMCAGDEGIYREVLETAWEEGMEKLPLIRECIEKRDYERYVIEVHGLKNTARIIGCRHLADRAMEQEKAAKERKIEAVEAGYRPLIREYGQMVDTLSDFFHGK